MFHSKVIGVDVKVNEWEDQLLFDQLPNDPAIKTTQLLIMMLYN